MTKLKKRGGADFISGSGAGSSPRSVPRGADNPARDRRMASVSHARASPRAIGARQVALALLPVLSLAISLVALIRSLPPLDPTRRAAVLSAVTPPHTLDDVNLVRRVMTDHARDSALTVAALIANAYVLMLALAIPGATWLSFLAGAVFGAARATALIALSITLGGSVCFHTSSWLGSALAERVWPEKTAAFRAEVRRRRGSLLNFILFLRLTPFVPNTVVNVLSPVVGVPYGVFALATCVGTLPQNFITASIGTRLAFATSAADLADWRSAAFGVLAGVVAVAPALMSGEEGRRLKAAMGGKKDGSGRREGVRRSPRTRAKGE